MNAILEFENRRRPDSSLLELNSTPTDCASHQDEADLDSAWGAFYGHITSRNEE